VPHREDGCISEHPDLKSTRVLQKTNFLPELEIESRAMMQGPIRLPLSHCHPTVCSKWKKLGDTHLFFYFSKHLSIILININQEGCLVIEVDIQTEIVDKDLEYFLWTENYTNLQAPKCKLHNDVRLSLEFCIVRTWHGMKVIGPIMWKQLRMIVCYWRPV